MEFLDAKSKRNRTIRLFVGYFLVAILIGLATLILVYLAQGYGYDTDKGVVRSGLVFVNAKPAAGGGADIYIDGQLQAKTDARLVINEGKHNLVLKKNNYRDWSKSFSLEGGSVLYFAYPMFIPKDIPLGVTRVYNSPPVWVSQSPDRRWLVLQQNNNSPVLTIIDLSKPSDSPLMATLPADQLLNQDGQFGKFIPVEWSDDNKHLLLNQTATNGKSAYIIFDRENVDLSQNINTALALTDTTKLTLRDKKYDKYFAHDTQSKTLTVADLKTKLAVTPLISNVVSFKSFADNKIIYITDSSVAGQAAVNILSDQTDKYKLQDIVQDSSGRYLLDIAQYDKNWYYIVASSLDTKALIYRNPLSRTKPGNAVALKPQMNLVINNPQFVSFSDNARFFSIQSGKKFIVYDGEQNRVMRYESPLAITPTQQANWMDGHRMTVVIDGKIQMFEFDGLNMQTLTASRPEYEAFFDRDYKNVYSFMQQSDGKTGFEAGQLVLN